MRLRSQSCIQIIGGSLHGLDVDRRSWGIRVVSEAGDDGSGHGNEPFSGLFLKPVRNSDALRHGNSPLVDFYGGYTNLKEFVTGDWRLLICYPKKQNQ
jgi:hypothetical protein